jgi:integrase
MAQALPEERWKEFIAKAKASAVVREVREECERRERRKAKRKTVHILDQSLDALKGNRHGHRDWLIGLMIYRHGLRVSEACELRWDDLDLAAGTINVRRLKGSRDSTHYLERDELVGPSERCVCVCQ